MKKPKQAPVPQPNRDQFETEEKYWDALGYWMDHHWRIKSTTEFLKERRYTAVKLWKIVLDQERAIQAMATEIKNMEREFSDWRQQAGEERARLLWMVTK